MAIIFRMLNTTEAPYWYQRYEEENDWATEYVLVIDFARETNGDENWQTINELTNQLDDLKRDGVDVGREKVGDRVVVLARGVKVGRVPELGDLRSVDPLVVSSVN